MVRPVCGMALTVVLIVWVAVVFGITAENLVEDGVSLWAHSLMTIALTFVCLGLAIGAFADD